MELLRALGVLAEPPEAEHRRLAEVLGLAAAPTPEAYTACFLLQARPCASIYRNDDGLLGGPARAHAAGVWLALGLEPPDEADHLAALLGLYASLVERAGAEAEPARRRLLENAAAAVLWEQLLSWVPPYLRAVRAVGDACYGSWAECLHAALVTEADRVPSPVPAAAADTRPAHGGEVDTIVTLLLAPRRGGLILTPADVTAIGATLGVPTAPGSRRGALLDLLHADRNAALEALASLAERWATGHAAEPAVLSPVVAPWEARARGSRDVLRAAARRGTQAAAHA